jgi:hypothetical protein
MRVLEKETIRHHLFESMKKVVEIGQGPVEQMRSVGCSIKGKGSTDVKRTTAPYIGVLPSHVRGSATIPPLFGVSRYSEDIAKNEVIDPKAT